jgi:hypothetical protein
MDGWFDRTSGRHMAMVGFQLATANARSPTNGRQSSTVVPPPTVGRMAIAAAAPK